MKRLFYTPSQVSEAECALSTLRIGGRVLDVRQSLQNVSLTLVDAIGSVKVVLASSTTTGELPEDGAFALVAGKLATRGHELVLENALLERTWPAPCPPELSEFWRTRRGSRGRNLRARSHLLKLLRTWFEDAGFLEVDTPSRVNSPGSDAYVNAFASEGKYLITSPEHHMKRLVAAGFYQVFQLAHCFRKDESGERHQPEFLMLEWYRAFASQLEMMDDTEAIVTATVSAFAPHRADRAEQLMLGALAIDLRRPFDRLTVGNAFVEFAGVKDAVDLAATDEAQYFQIFVDRVEPRLTELTRPVFLVDFPSTQAALARRNPADERVAERFELYLGGVELCNGYTELTSAEEFLERQSRENDRKRSEGVPSYPTDLALYRALQHGFPPSGGNALGVDRLLALALGEKDIRNVVSFPEPDQPVA